MRALMEARRAQWRPGLAARANGGASGQRHWRPVASDGARPDPGAASGGAHMPAEPVARAPRMTTHTLERALPARRRAARGRRPDGRAPARSG